MIGRDKNHNDGCAVEHRNVMRGHSSSLVPYIVAAVIFIVIPAVAPGHLQSIMTKVVIYALFAMGLNITFGYAGLLSLGHAAFFGTGGYTAGILVTKLGVTSFWPVVVAAVVVTVIIAAVFGVIALRVSGIYFLLLTFALSMLLMSVAIKWDALTNGVNGITNIQRPELFGAWPDWNVLSFYYFVFVIAVVSFVLIKVMMRSPLGMSFQGIRDSEVRMSALGYNVWLHRYLAFILGALFAGVAGVLFAYHSNVIAPFHISVTTSALAMLLCILGGLGSSWGPIVGALIVIVIEYFASIYAAARWPLILGGLFVVVVVLLPDGVVPAITRGWTRMVNGSHKS